MADDRGDLMARRVDTTMVAMGVDRAERGAVLDALRLALASRRDALPDDRDPRYLHPARCVLILLDDLAVTDAVELSAAAFLDTEDPSLTVPLSRIRLVCGAAVAELVQAVPGRSADSLAEDLLAAVPNACRLALVERLDQIRHAHLWTQPERRKSAHETARSVYLPVAERSSEVLARRYRWWCRMFERRYLRRS